MAGEQLVSQTVAETVKWTDKVTAIIGVATLVLAVVGAVLAYRSYKQRTDEIAAQNKLDRFKNYLVANQVFETDKGILSVRNAAESGNWSTVSKDDRYDFMSFYEQLALMMQSGCNRSHPPLHHLSEGSRLPFDRRAEGLRF